MSDRGILWEKVYYFSLLLQLIRCLDTCLQFIDSSIRLFFIWIIHLIATYCCLGKKAIPKYPIYVKLKVGILSSRNTIFRIYYIQFGILWYMSHDGNCAIDSERKDELPRIEALGCKVMQWNNYWVSGIFDMSILQIQNWLYL